MAKDIIIDLNKLSVFKDKMINFFNQHKSNQNIHMSDEDHQQIDVAYSHTQLPHAPTTIATDLDNGLMSAEDKAKLDAVSNNANYYIHPNTHAADMIVTDNNHQFVSESDKKNWDSIYQQSTGYTDAKIAELINGAPSTLDTLGEIAQAMSNNTDVVNALNQSIGNKADSLELDGHTGNSTIHITASERTKWNNKIDYNGNASSATVTFSEASSLSSISTGEKLSVIMSKVSKAIASLISHVGAKATAGSIGHVVLSDTYNKVLKNGAAANGTGASQKAVADAYSALNNSLGGLTFEQDAEGNWGYKPAGADTVTPFKKNSTFNVVYQGIFDNVIATYLSAANGYVLYRIDTTWPQFAGKYLIIACVTTSGASRQNPGIIYNGMYNGEKFNVNVYDGSNVGCPTRVTIYTVSV